MRGTTTHAQTIDVLANVDRLQLWQDATGRDPPYAKRHVRRVGEHFS